MAETEKKPVRKRAPRKTPAKSKKKDKTTWVHVDNYLMTLQCREEVKHGFRAFMAKRAYQKSYDAFDAYFKEYTNS